MYLLTYLHGVSQKTELFLKVCNSCVFLAHHVYCKICVFTALHGMQTRYSDIRKLSVCPSVCRTREL